MVQPTKILMRLLQLQTKQPANFNVNKRVCFAKVNRLNISLKFIVVMKMILSLA